MKIVLNLLLVVAVAIGGVSMVSVNDSYANTTEIQAGIDSVDDDNPPKLRDSIKTMVNVLIFTIGAVAVTMIIFGGFRYATSAGDAAAVSSAKSTILYAVIGLVVAVLGYAIVNFVVGALNAPKTWADCMKIEDLAERKKCQNKMIANGASDLPESLIPTR